MTPTTTPQQDIEDEIADLERRLRDAKARLTSDDSAAPALVPAAALLPLAAPSHDSLSPTPLHALLLLSDSALPLGSFAFSSGLESYLAHHKPPMHATTPQSQLPAFHVFLQLSLASLASSALPYVMAAWRSPEQIGRLDDEFDACTLCAVARRASVAQGRALVGVWERSFRGAWGDGVGEVEGGEHSRRAREALTRFSLTLKTTPPSSSSSSSTTISSAYPTVPSVHAHLAPLWGLITALLALPLYHATYLFLFSHARTVLSAAVRASVMGPYQAQAVLASRELRERIGGLVEEGWDVPTEEAGLGVPVMDLWVGRHERLYSRIFNS